MEKWYFTILNSLIDFLFLVDIVASFRTTYIDKSTGDEITNLRLIAINYLKSRFWIDLLATIPLDTIGEAIAGGNVPFLQVFGLLKLVRVLRLGRIITYLNTKQDLKMGLKLGKLIFFLVIYMHCLGCMWYMIVEPG